MNQTAKKDFSTNMIGSLFDISSVPEPSIKPIIIPDNMTVIKTAAEKELGLSVVPTVKDIRKDKYKSDNILEPKSRAEHDKYIKMYVDYVSSNFTQIELAKKYSLSNVHVSRIIKYATFQMGEADQAADLRSIVDGLEVRKTKIQAEIDSSLDVDEKVKLWGTLNKTDKLMSQLKGLLGTALIDMSDKSQNVTVEMNPDLVRRSGDAKGGEDSKTIEMKSDDKLDLPDEFIEEDNNDAADDDIKFKRRTGDDEEPDEINLQEE